MSNNWPTAPLIRIVRGYDVRTGELEGEYAVRDRDGDYYTPNIGTLIKDSNDRIDEWEEVTAIPTAALKRLQGAFRGATLGVGRFNALQEVLSCLPADKPSALDRAVTRVKDADGRMIDAKSTQEDRLSLLLDALASVQSAARKTAPLTMVARICADWANLENPRRDSLETARERTKVLSDPGSFIVLSALVGDVTTALCDNFSPRHDLIDVAAYALAWAAQTIEEEDR